MMVVLKKGSFLEKKQVHLKKILTESVTSTSTAAQSSSNGFTHKENESKRAAYVRHSQEKVQAELNMLQENTQKELANLRKKN